MAARYDLQRTAHKAWLGLLQPVGLVVSPPALIKAQAVIDRNVLAIQQALMAVVRQPTSEPTDGDSVLDDVPASFARCWSGTRTLWPARRAGHRCPST